MVVTSAMVHVDVQLGKCRAGLLPGHGASASVLGLRFFSLGLVGMLDGIRLQLGAPQKKRHSKAYKNEHAGSQEKYATFQQRASRACA